jgi:hypothetical protein
MSSNSPKVRTDKVAGSHTFSTFAWALVLTFGGLWFLVIAISSFYGASILPFVDFVNIPALPNGLVRGGYGTVGVALGLYNFSLFFLKYGSGFNEYNREKKNIRIFRWSVPGSQRRIELVFNLEDVKEILLSARGGFSPKREVYLVLKNGFKANLTNGSRNSEPVEVLEAFTVDLAGFLGKPPAFDIQESGRREQASPVSFFPFFRFLFACLLHAVRLRRGNTPVLWVSRGRVFRPLLPRPIFVC